MDKLLPCPFCGGNNCRTHKFTPDSNFACWGVWCLTCSAKVTGFESEQQAIAAWNRRAQQEDKPLTLDELRGLDGEPVWVESLEAPENSEWAIIDIEADEANGKSGCFPLTLYGWNWRAFRSKPKEEALWK